MLSVDINDVENYVGKDLGHSEWMLIDQKRINLFADATEDHQWIHVDEERAKNELPTQTTIAHGFLSLSLSVPLAAQVWTVTGAKMIINYGLNKVRFINPVPAGSRIRATSQTIDVVLKGNAIDMTRLMTVEIEGQEKPALIAEWIGRTVFA